MKARTMIAFAAAGAALVPALAHRPLGVAGPPDPRHVRGALHVHGPFSDDARGSLDHIAREARRAGLDFVVITDHGRDEAPVGYRQGVLVLVGMEKSTDAGHALVLGASPLAWRLDGDPATVVRDAHAQGGFVLAAHPGSVRPESRWTAGCVGLAGLEVVNFGEPAAWPRGLGLLPVLMRYPFDDRGALIGALRPQRNALDLWDACLAERPMAGWLGSDAHGGLRAGPLFVPIPSHRAIFRLGSNHLRLAEPWNGDAAHDARLVWNALRAGHGYSALDSLADATGFRFAIGSGGKRAGPGENLVLAEGLARLEAEASASAATELVLVRNGQEVARGPRLAQDVGAGLYRVEAYLDPRAVPGGRRLPWILSNAIGVFPGPQQGERTARAAPPLEASAAPTVDVQDFESGPLAEHWQMDHAADAGSAIRAEKGALRWDLRLGASPRTYASIADYRRRDFSRASGLAFRVRGSQRFRFDVQVRVRDGAAVRLWRRSALAGGQWARVHVPFAALTTYDRRGGRPDLSRVEGVYFVAETAHLPPGWVGTLWLDDVGLVP